MATHTRCDKCGRFISIAEIENNKAVSEDVSGSDHPADECWAWWHIDCWNELRAEGA